MNLRLLILPVLALLFAPCAGGQQICNGSDENAWPVRAAAHSIVPVAPVSCGKGSANVSDPKGVGPQPVAKILTRAELLRRIGVYQAALQGPGVALTSNAVLAEAYEKLALLYEDVAMNERAEGALQHAVSLSRGNAEWSGQLAEELNDLGVLHAETGKLHEAEKEELEALRIRESLGDSLGIARSWNSLSGLYFKERKYAMSRDFAQRAMGEFSTDKNADVVDRISSRFYLSVALCYTKDCPSAVPVLKDAIDLAKSTFKPSDYPVGEGTFLLGFAYWKSGDISRASEYMEEGTTIMKEELGWGHPTYLNALGQYARFLRENRRGDDAEAVERQIRQAESVVDVRSMQTRSGTDSLAGLR